MGILVPNPSAYEETLHEMTVGDLTMKLTNEKLFINSLGSSETFALRSISGIGVIDAIDDYNNELNNYQKAMNEKKLKPILIGFLGFFLLLVDFPNVFLIISGLVLICIAIYGFLNLKQIAPPTMKPIVRVMLSGNNRDFSFSKNAKNSSEVGRFVALIEDSLTSYHRN